MNSPEMTRRFLDTTALDMLRRTVDWQSVCDALNIAPDPKRSKPGDWWASSPFAEDTTPSFHVKPDDGVWYCFSTQQGGGVIELVQRLHGSNCFEAGEWLIEQGCAPEPDALPSNNDGKKKAPERNAASTPSEATGEGKTDKTANKPIRQSLLPMLTAQGTHPEFVERGISEKTCHYLGCGYLEKGRSKLKDRIVFQVRGVQATDDGLEPVIITHTARAVTDEQLEADGKWLSYKGFRKTAALYNIDKLLLDPIARDQIRRTGRVVMVEGPFDVAKLVEAGLCNVIATLGADLSEEAKPLLDLIGRETDNPEFLIWYDRDKAGRAGRDRAIALLDELKLAATAFDWDARFGDDGIAIPESITDPCAMNMAQLRWLRAKGLI